MKSNTNNQCLYFVGKKDLFEKAPYLGLLASYQCQLAAS